MARQPREGDCQRCGAEGSYLYHDLQVLMSEVYHANLCLNCRNDWDAYIIKHPARAARNKSTDDMNMVWAMTCGDGVDRSEQIAALRSEWDSLNAQLRAIAMAWVEQTITR